ncbi:hypothetical protein OG280_41295 (plasmid) [Streptomyces virginiae]|uniref:hypothetical protein n=1 Tax=Streptomyces virginiae TaxID=1961 RepID=UPI002DDB9F55|nr:hypothetical protein [Streptomyces virginiae]WSC82774.1 hypothetical protein OHA56_40965 [Streptomyces virginiae]
MRRRLAGLLLALAAVFAMSVSAPQPAAAADPIAGGVRLACGFASGVVGTAILGPAGGVAGGFGSGALCDKVSKKVAEEIKEEWKEVKDSILGDIIVAIEDAAKWTLKKVLTVALMGPSVDLLGTGLWSGKATLAGMLVWLGWLIAAAGVMWQIGKMALTGQAKHLGRAMRGWVENIVLCVIGVGLFITLLEIGDAMSTGLVNAVFKADDAAFERIIAVMIPKGIGNPMLMLGIVQLMVIIGFVQLIMVFLRQSAIPIICLLLPVAGGGRAGGDATRQWAPKLITSGLVIVAYKPILAIIVCTGFSEFGKAETLAEWLRGCATLILGILAPGPLTKLFAPFGEAVGGGMATGGASGALGAAAGYIGGKGDKGDKGGGDGPTSAAQHAQYVQKSMGPQGNGQGGGQGNDALAQAGRNGANAKIPAQGAGTTGATGASGAPGVAGTTGTASTAGTAGVAGAAGPIGIGIAAGVQIMDGVNNAAGEVGGGNK